MKLALVTIVAAMSLAACGGGPGSPLMPAPTAAPTCPSDGRQPQSDTRC